MKSSLPFLLLVSAAFVPDAAEAQAPDSTNKHAPIVLCRAARLTEKISVDGKLDEHVWSNGNAITDFKQRDPNEGTTPSQKTEVRVAYDDEAVYVGARMYDAAPDSILARLSRRDVSVQSDRFSFYLDPLHDKRSGYYFLINAAGTLFDGTLSNDGWEDSSWDGVWDAKARVDEQGWTAEMRIPYSQLRFASQGDRMTWGVNFRRVIQRHNEEVFLVYQPKKESGFVSRFPDLTGFEGVKAGSSIEFLPYVTGKAAYLLNGTEHDPNGGFDLRMPVGGRMTLNGTVNPDFGQVEVDPAVVNISDNETFYPEKRPFFVEGSANFRFGNEGASDYWGFNWPEPTFFYSRRIGAADETILGATKLTGKLAPSVNVGAVAALTDDEAAPQTFWGDVGMLKEFRGRQQGLGFKVNGTGRKFDDHPEQADIYNENSLFAGLDGWWFLDSKKKWVISGWSGMSHVTGNEQRIADIQTSSRHYMQRPDADEFQFDPTRTSLTGTGTRLWLNKQSGNIFLNAAAGYMSRAFEVNDIGFMSRADVVNAHFGTGYKWTETTKHRKYQDVIVALFTSYDLDGNRQNAGLWTQGATEFQNNHSWNYRLAFFPGSMSSRRTRGGPLMRTNDGYEVGTYYDTDGKSKVFWWIDVGTFQQPVENSYNYYVYPGLELKPVSNVVLRFEPGYEQVAENAQYVTAYADPAMTETFGTRYVFGRLSQRTFVAGIRLNWAFSPTTSLQFYGQPLLSTGEYREFKALARPGSYDFVPDYSLEPGSQDFNIKSLRGNAIFRWEYRPGSALFLVWSQSRLNDQVDPTDSGKGFSKSLSSLLETDAENIFLAKLTYYFSL